LGFSLYSSEEGAASFFNCPLKRPRQQDAVMLEQDRSAGGSNRRGEEQDEHIESQETKQDQV